MVQPKQTYAPYAGVSNEELEQIRSPITNIFGVPDTEIPGVGSGVEHALSHARAGLEYDAPPAEIRKSPFKYLEGDILNELHTYIESTYGQHYVGKDSQGIQMNDLFLSMGTAEDFWKSNAAKYVMRYGKKKGKNRADLLKAAHYVILLLYLNQIEEQS